MDGLKHIFSIICLVREGMAVPAVPARWTVERSLGLVVQCSIMADGAVRDIQYRCWCAADIDTVIQRIGSHIVPVGFINRIDLVWVAALAPFPCIFWWGMVICMAQGAVSTRFCSVNATFVHSLIHIDWRCSVVIHCSIVIMARCAAFSGHFMTMKSIDSLVVDIVAFQTLCVIPPFHVKNIMFIRIRTRAHAIVDEVAFCAVRFWVPCMCAGMVRNIDGQCVRSGICSEGYGSMAYNATSIVCWMICWGIQYHSLVSAVFQHHADRWC